uniref:RING-type E3 ubiquitin transferase n=1 Tax=Varanus komodoensis TaxID=61221 RepID=A0A8D2IP57_VARKO
PEAHVHTCLPQGHRQPAPQGSFWEAAGGRGMAFVPEHQGSCPVPTPAWHWQPSPGRQAGFSSQRICLDCKKDFCPACAHQPESGPCLCHLCERFRATAFRREELIKMKVKELRDYLELREISTELCREKDELVCVCVCFLYLSHRLCFPLWSSYKFRGWMMGFIICTAGGLQGGAGGGGRGRRLGCGTAASAPGCALPQSTDSEDTLVAGRRASLSDLTSASDIDGLSVRQLKEILARNFVNYKGCCEKWELMERVTRLYKEKDLQGVGPSNLCKICMDAAIDCVLLECGHMVTCTKCGMRMSECPICRQYVIRAVHVFRT